MQDEMKKRIIFWILSGVFFIVCSCAPSPLVIKPITLERAPRESGQAAVDETQAAKTKGTAEYEVLKPPAFQRTAPEKKLPPREPIDPKRFTATDVPVLINAEKMPLSDFVIYALGETLKIAFVMDEATMNNKHPVSMRMPEAMPPDKALGMVLGLLEKNGLFVEETAGALYILQKAPDTKGPFAIKIGRNIEDSPVDILQIVPLKHIKTPEIEWLIKDIIKTGIQIKVYPKENVFLLYGRAFQMKQIMELIETFDVPSLQNKQLFLIRLTYWQIDDFIKEISRILTGLGFNIAKSHMDPGPLFMPIKTLNSILVVSPDEDTTKYILEWKTKLDTPEAAGSEERSYTFTPQFTKASDLVSSIQKLYGVVSPATKSPTPTTAPSATTGPTAPAATAVVLPDLKIAADDNKNIVVIMALPERYKTVLSLLRALDTPTKQVLIEATIAELTLTDQLQYGVEWYVKNTLQGGQYTLGTFGNLGLSPLGLSFQFLSQTGNVQALVSALANLTKVNILSTPRLTVLDNKEATIQVGTDVPTVTSNLTSVTAATTAETNVLQSIQYRSTGVLLRVKPTINTEGLLTLDISQEVSDIGAAGVSGSPTILTRKINTTVVVGHGQTIVLGGLMKESDTLAENKVPLLGDIPGIGNLFKYTSKTKEKTELLVLVTPTIMISIDDAAKITAEIRKELKWLK
jgi:general secretion pathway protein D